MMGRRCLAALFCALTEPAAGGAAAPHAPARVLRIDTALLYEMRRRLLPGGRFDGAERLMMGALRRDGAVASLGAVYDITGAATPVHVAADEAKVLDALVEMDRSGAYFGFLAHCHPGDDARATRPSAEDYGTLVKRMAAGDSPGLTGAIVAGDYLCFYGPRTAPPVQLVGGGLRPLDTWGELYVFA